MAYPSNGISKGASSREESMGAVLQQHNPLSSLVDMEKRFTTSNTNMVEILLQAYKRCKWKELCGYCTATVQWTGAR